MNQNRIARSARMLAIGRAPGLIAAFAIPLVLARVFEPAEFGTYKQLFLIYATLFGIAQLGMAESLYYFVPRDKAQAGRFAANAICALSLIGLVVVALLFVNRHLLADWMTNGALASYALMLGVFSALMLVSAVFEIILIARQRSGGAAWVYALTDIGRAAFLTVPAMLALGLRGVMAGAVTFAIIRVIATVVALVREFGADLRVDRVTLRTQLAYALPFALAVGIEVLYLNWHQYAVASRFDPAAFAIYAVGCLQVPVVDLIVMSTCNVMMVEMARTQERDSDAARWLWHDSIGRLAFMIFPLAAFLIVMGHEIIVVLFTSTYQASVPIFRLWSLTMLASVLLADGVLRVFAQTRYLLFQNVLQLAIVASLAGVFLNAFGLQGAVLVTLAATVIVKTLAVARISRLMHLPLREALPWRRLATATACAAVAAIPVLAVSKVLMLSPMPALIAAAATYALAYGALYMAVNRHTPAPPLLRATAS